MCFYSIPTVVRLWWCVMILFCPLSGSLSLPFRLQQLTRLFSASVRSVMPFPSTVIGADGTMGIGPPSSNHPWEWLDNENWDGRELLFSSLIANGTTTSASSSTVRYLSSPTRNRQHTYANDKHTYKDNFDSDDKSLGSRMFSAEALQRWWTRHTAGHRGLLIFLIPSLLRSVTDCLSVCMLCFSHYSLVLSSIRRFLDDLLVCPVKCRCCRQRCPSVWTDYRNTSRPCTSASHYYCYKRRVLHWYRRHCAQASLWVGALCSPTLTMRGPAGCRSRQAMTATPWSLEPGTDPITSFGLNNAINSPRITPYHKS